MQKKIIALAIAAAFSVPAVAMADATVYGVVDGGFRSDTAAGSTSNTMGSGVKDSNRWGIKASEDLGDGMKANVKLEGDLVTGTGEGKANTTTTTLTGTAPAAITGAKSTTNNNLFSRQSTVGIEGGFGSLDMGYQYSVAFKLNTLIDPFGHNYIGLTWANMASGSAPNATTNFLKPSATRYSNNFSYTNKMGDLTVMAEHALGDGSGYGSTTGAGVAYASGPITAVFDFSKTKSATTNAAPDTTYMQLGGAFNFGDGAVKAGYSSQVVAAASAATQDLKTTFMWVGANFNVSSKINVTGAYYKLNVSQTGQPDGDANNMVVGVSYALSKKTAAYVEADKQTIVGSGGSADVNTNGYAVGLSVAF